jgi:hypothetical protein
MVTQTNVKTQTGNRLRVLFNGIQVGLVQSVRMSDDYGPDAASGIGDIHAVEYVPTMARHTLSVSNMQLKKAGLRELGISVENGEAMLKGIVIDIVLFDKDDGRELRKYVGCSYASGDVDVSKHAIVQVNGTFNALDVVGLGL